MKDIQVGTTTNGTIDGRAAASFSRPSSQQGPVDLTRLLSTAGIVLGVVLVACRLTPRTAAARPRSPWDLAVGSA